MKCPFVKEGSLGTHAVYVAHIEKGWGGGGASINQYCLTHSENAGNSGCVLSLCNLFFSLGFYQAGLVDAHLVTQPLPYEAGCGGWNEREVGTGR